MFTPQLLTTADIDQCFDLEHHHMNNMFPESLRPYQQIITSTATPAALLILKEENTVLYQSKIGGMPYFPYDYPVDFFYVPHPNTVNYTPWPKHPETGRELFLLLQINFEEMPHLPSFPRKGILQLFVDDNHWHHLDRYLRVIYHPEVFREEELLFTSFNKLQDVHSVPEYSVSFHKEDEYITNSDFRFARLLPDIWEPGNQQRWIDYLNITDHRFSKEEKKALDYRYGKHKISGYHYSQNAQDPRASLPDWEDSVLLVQFQDYEYLYWGDLGSAQFFIKRKDLEALNFQELLFHWDST